MADEMWLPSGSDMAERLGDGDEERDLEAYYAQVWRPIETAPPNQHVLVYLYQTAGQPGWQIRIGVTYDGTLWLYDNGHRMWDTPTHWMALPAPPPQSIPG